jgi:hypothetical protein
LVDHVDFSDEIGGGTLLFVTHYQHEPAQSVSRGAQLIGRYPNYIFKTENVPLFVFFMSIIARRTSPGLTPVRCTPTVSIILILLDGISGITCCETGTTSVHLKLEKRLFLSIDERDRTNMNKCHSGE